MSNPSENQPSEPSWKSFPKTVTKGEVPPQIQQEQRPHSDPAAAGDAIPQESGSSDTAKLTEFIENEYLKAREVMEKRRPIPGVVVFEQNGDSIEMKATPSECYHVGPPACFGFANDDNMAALWEAVRIAAEKSPDGSILFSMSPIHDPEMQKHVGTVFQLSEESENDEPHSTAEDVIGTGTRPVGNTGSDDDTEGSRPAELDRGAASPSDEEEN